MKIESDMRIINKNGLVAIGSITLDEIITIQDVKVLDRSSEEERAQGKENWMISMPRRKGKEGWNGVIFLRNAAIQEKIEEKVYEGIRKNLMCDLNAEPEFDVHITLYSKDTLAGYANVLYENAVEIRGIQIHRDREGIRIKLPYNPNDGKFQSLIQMNTERVYDLLKVKIEEAYHQAVQEREACKDGRERR